MDITQIPIKINQTNQSDGGKPKTISKSEDLVNSFDQILAMFNFGGKSPNSDEQSATSLQNLSNTESGQINPTTIQEEDWLQLDAILTALIAGIQQGPNAQANESFQPVESDLLSQKQFVPIYDNNSMAQMLQIVKDFSQTSTMDNSQLNHGIAQLISDLQLLDKQKTLEIPSNIKDKLQLIMDEFNSGNNIDRSTLLNNQLQKNELFAAENGSAKPMLSLDKNQVMFSFIPETETSIKGISDFVRDPITKPSEDLTKFFGQMLVKHQQMQVPNGSIAPKTESSFPLLQVSEFSSEVSEWISSNIRLTNGQQGSTQVKFSLFPEHLGHIEIKITSQQGMVSAQILTDTSLAKEALEGQLHQLKQSLLQQGIVVHKLDIVQQTPVPIDLNQASLSFSQGGSGSSPEQRTSPEQELSKNQEDTDQNELDTETISLTYRGAPSNTTSSIDFTA